MFFLNLLLVLSCANSFGQKQTFDIATYTTPNGWTEKQEEDKISYSRIDAGSWAQIAIYKSTASTGNIDADFDKDWNELAAVNKSISAPQKTKTATHGRWTVMSGSGTWQYNGANVSSILTVYSNKQVCISVLCNATAATFLKDYQTLIASLTLHSENVQAISGTQNNSENGDSAAVVHANGIAGLWVVNLAESRGFVNGHLMYTGGYTRKEYQLSEDGTYTFRIKVWLASSETIYFVYESGNWTVSGNQLTITPKKGKGGWWNKDKVTNNVDKWGSFQKDAGYKLQTITYRFEIKEDSNYGNSIVLYSNKPTERDGGQFNEAPYRFSYTFRQSGKPYIDNPPGWKF